MSSTVSDPILPQDTLWRKLKRRYWHTFSLMTFPVGFVYGIPMACALLWLWRASCPSWVVFIAGSLWFLSSLIGLLLTGFTVVISLLSRRKIPASSWLSFARGLLVDGVTICTLFMGRMDIAILVCLILRACMGFLVGMVKKRKMLWGALQYGLLTAAFLISSGWFFLAALALLGLSYGIRSWRKTDFWAYAAAKPSRSAYVQRQQEACASGHG
jgi:hypothetical protein